MLFFRALFAACLLTGFAHVLCAQTLDSVEIADYGNPEEVEVGAVNVTGAVFSDETAIKSIGGINVGDQVRIPGPEITRAVRALMRLRLFTDVQVFAEETAEGVVSLEYAIVEQPRLSSYRYTRVKKRYHDDLNERLEGVLVKGGIVNENLKRNAANKIKEYFEEKGYLDTEVGITEGADSIRANSVILTLDVDRGPKVKIQDLDFTGNESVADRKLRKLMKETRRKRKIFSSSKFIPEEYAADKEKLVDYYNTIGYRDARILGDTTYRQENGDLGIRIDLSEGTRYFFRDIVFKGNVLYTEKQLTDVLGIVRGDIYNKTLLDERLSFSENGRDVSSLYLDEGYLFFQVDPVETSVENDSIDLEIRIFEGPQATVDQVVIRGNDRTHENVIRRELRVRPGDKFSRSDLIRSQREIVGLGFFDPQALGINTPVNPDRGTVDIEFDLEEKANDQLELSMGWGGAGFGLFGTVGVSFNNFSVKDAFDGKPWRPYPTGDAQRVSLRLQSSGPSFFSTTASFTEPWLGGKKPTSLSVVFNYNRLGNAVRDRNDDRYGSFNIYTASVGLGTRLRWPDDNFTYQFGIKLQHYDLDNFFDNRAGAAIFRTDDGIAVGDGTYTDFAIEQTLTRSSVVEPIFPTSGANLELKLSLTPPYSQLNNRDYDSEAVSERYRWVEYHRWRLSGEWYKTLTGKLVVKSSIKMGFLGRYSDKFGRSPFQRFQIGGDGLNNSQIARYTGTEIIASRGYEQEDFANNFISTPEGVRTQTPTAIFNKLALELRYPISLNPSATFFVLGFVEGSNAWQSVRDYNPFDLKRSAGAGIRVFLPMFGTLGFDYGIGFDKLNETGQQFGQQEGLKGLGSFGKLNIILGFEPE